MKRVPWTQEENELLLSHWNQANGAFLTYEQEADCLNKSFHKAHAVRNRYSVMRNPNSGGIRRLEYGTTFAKKAK